VEGSDDKDPVVGKVTVRAFVPSTRRTRHATSKIPTSKAATVITATQAATMKKRKRRGTVVSTNK
jgi:hypothetical protein